MCKKVASQPIPSAVWGSKTAFGHLALTPPTRAAFKVDRVVMKQIRCSLRRHKSFSIPITNQIDFGPAASWFHESLFVSSFEFHDNITSYNWYVKIISYQQHWYLLQKSQIYSWSFLGALLGHCTVSMSIAIKLCLIQIPLSWCKTGTMIPLDRGSSFLLQFPMHSPYTNCNRV